MRTKRYQAKDIAYILAIPKTTILDRIVKLQIVPTLKFKIGGHRKFYYSESQLNKIRQDFECHPHKPQPKVNDLIAKDQKVKDDEDAMARQIQARQNGLDAENKAAEDQMAIDKAVADNKLEVANLTLNLLGSLAKKGSKLAKGVAVAQATMDTYKGATAAYAAGSSLPGPAGIVGGPLMAALAVAAGFMNVKNILSTKDDGTGGGVGSAPAAPSAPSFNLVQGTGSNQIASSIGKQQPIEAFVVSRNVSTAQEMDRNIVKTASI